MDVAKLEEKATTGGDLVLVALVLGWDQLGLGIVGGRVGGLELWL